MTRITFKKFITEWTHVPKGIIKYLEKLGYRLLGKGVDQIAFLEPKTDQVLKVFGADIRERNEAHNMFELWANYCKDRPNNPFLPKFSGWTKFTYEDNNYLQIRMEKLQHLPPKLAFSLESVAVELHQSNSPQRVKSKILKNLGGHGGFSMRHVDGVDIQNFDEINKLAIMLGEKDFNLLLDTIMDLSKIADGHSYDFDLHGRNFMHRNDGTPVIVDPWVV